MATIGNFQLAKYSTARSSRFPSRPRRSGSSPIRAPAAKTHPATACSLVESSSGCRLVQKVQRGRAYLGLKLDGPCFTAPIYANLVADEGGQSYSLIWSRPNRRNGD